MNKRILFINNYSASSPIPGLIAGAGYGVVTTFNADTVFSEPGDRSYDLIILLESPYAESWVTCEKIRRMSGTPLIVISSSAPAENCVKAINAGADFFIRKPFGPLELLARINSLLQRVPGRQLAPLVP